jgi:hypothetical protein
MFCLDANTKTVTDPNPVRRAADVFHAHCDDCRMCTQHLLGREDSPASLCTEGHKLLMAVGRAKTEEMIEAERQRLRDSV